MTAVTSEAPRDLPFFFEQKYREPATFMTLPVELRLEIYSYLLVLPEEWNPAKQAAPPALYPEILSACQQTYEEALPMLYKPNKFTAHPNFLTTIPRLHTTRTPVYASHLGSLIQRFYLPVRLDADPAFDGALLAAVADGFAVPEAPSGPVTSQDATNPGTSRSLTEKDVPAGTPETRADWPSANETSTRPPSGVTSSASPEGPVTRTGASSGVPSSRASVTSKANSWESSESVGS